jgi:hypothetical protein
MKALARVAVARKRLIKEIEQLLPSPAWNDSRYRNLVTLVYGLEADAQWAGEARQRWREARRR